MAKGTLNFFELYSDFGKSLKEGAFFYENENKNFSCFQNYFTIIIYSKKMWILIILIGLLSPFLIADDTSRPILLEFWTPKNLAENKTVRLTCALLQGSSAVNFEWFLNDQKIDQNNNRRIIINEESSELVIKSLSVDDLGDYTCTAKNQFGQDSQNVSLYFNSKLF